jgi:hypothetical protein
MPGEIANQNHYFSQEEKMKKFWIVLIALGLVAAFSMSASAADVKFSGSYYIEGWYDDNHSLLSKDDTSTIANRGPIALYHQRFRLQTEFKVAEGLTLTTRFDALEKNWGDRRDRNGGDLSTGYATPSTAATVENASRRGVPTYNGSSGGYAQGTSTTASANTQIYATQEQANIEFERVYITANLPFGVLIAGYAEDIKWGTDFMDTVTTRPLIKLIVPIGNLTLVAAIKKDMEGTMYNGYGAMNTGDKDIYDLAGVYKWKSGEAGLLFEYLIGNATRSSSVAANASYATRIWGLFPYFKQTFGPVYLEAEAYYGAGIMADFDVAAGSIQKSLETMGGSIHAKVDLKPVYFGGRFIYMMGDDPNTRDKQEGTVAAQLVAGQAFLPCLMLFNDSYYTAMGGGLGGRASFGYSAAASQAGVAAGNAAAFQFMDNVIFFQGYVGVKPVDKLDVFASVTYATAQNKPNDALGARYVSDIYGTEIDVTATYKIYDNLSYMVGFGYLFTGDYFKGSDPSAKITNDYILMHKLTLTF